jgi:hypothetical protein
MIDLHPAPVPELDTQWIAAHRVALVDTLGRPRRKPVTWAALAGAAGAATTLSAVMLVGGSAPSAFAGWSPSPTPPANGQLTAADASCQASLDAAARMAPSNKNPQPGAPLTPEVSDVRGPYTITVFGNGGQPRALCISTPGATSLRWVAPWAKPVGTGAISVDQFSILAREGQPYTLVEGRMGAGVSAVTLALGNGSTVTATTGGGMFVAWWPGSQTIVSASVTTPSGVSTQPLNVAGPPVPPSPKTPPPGAFSGSSDGTSTACLGSRC